MQEVLEVEKRKSAMIGLPSLLPSSSAASIALRW